MLEQTVFSDAGEEGTGSTTIWLQAHCKNPFDFANIIENPLKTFAFMILARIEALLEAYQPEEQHGFPKHRQMDENLLTATLFLDKTWDKRIPIWIVSLDLTGRSGMHCALPYMTIASLTISFRFCT